MLHRYATPLLPSKTINVIDFGVKTVHKSATNGCNLDSLKYIVSSALQIGGVNANTLKYVTIIVQNIDTTAGLLSHDLHQIIIKTVNSFLQLFRDENALL